MSDAEWEARFPLPDPDELSDVAYVQAVLAEMRELLSCLQRQSLRAAVGEPEPEDTTPYIRSISGRLQKLIGLRLGDVFRRAGNADPSCTWYWGVEFNALIESVGFNAYCQPEPQVLKFVARRVAILDRLAKTLRGAKAIPSVPTAMNEPPAELEAGTGKNEPVAQAAATLSHDPPTTAPPAEPKPSSVPVMKDRQALAIAVLMADNGNAFTKLAEQIGVSPKTLYDWMKPECRDGRFRAAVGGIGRLPGKKVSNRRGFKDAEGRLEAYVGDPRRRPRHDDDDDDM